MDTANSMVYICEPVGVKEVLGLFYRDHVHVGHYTYKKQGRGHILENTDFFEVGHIFENTGIFEELWPAYPLHVAVIYPEEW